MKGWPCSGVWRDISWAWCDISHTPPISVFSSLDALMCLWDLEFGKWIKSIDAGWVDAWTSAFSPDSQYLATGTHVGESEHF